MGSSKCVASSSENAAIQLGDGTSPFIGERALFVDRNIFTYSSSIHKLFKSHDYCSFEELRTLDVEKIINKAIDRVVFSNPYVTLRHEKLYGLIRQADFPILICERGALPGAAFLDDDGFLTESGFYSEDSIERNRRGKSDTSIDILREKYFSRPALEKQNKHRPHLSEIEERIVSAAEPKKPKVLFILQSRNDIAVKKFGYMGQLYDEFLDMISQIAASETDKYEFYFKPHPREPEMVIEGAQSVADKNIIDAILDVDTVLTFTSGVGVLTMLLERKVGYFGDAFYKNSRAAKRVGSKSDFEDLMNVENSVFSEPRQTFLNYLDDSYCDVQFWGRSINFFSNRDVVCRYRNIRVRTNGKFHEVKTVPRSWLGVAFESLSRFFSNRKLGRKAA